MKAVQIQVSANGGRLPDPISTSSGLEKSFRHLQEPRLGSSVFSIKAWNAIGRSLKLSGRERQIVRRVFDDRTEFAIACELGVSPHTIHTHFERLHRKLNVHDRTQMLLRVTREFLRLTVSPDGDLPPLCSHHAAGKCPFDA